MTNHLCSHQQIFEATGGKKDGNWMRLFTAIPNSIVQIEIVGSRGVVGYSGVLIDDLKIWKCTEFREQTLSSGFSC